MNSKFKNVIPTIAYGDNKISKYARDLGIKSDEDRSRLIQINNHRKSIVLFIVQQQTQSNVDFNYVLRTYRNIEVEFSWNQIIYKLENLKNADIESSDSRVIEELLTQSINLRQETLDIFRKNNIDVE